MNRENELPTSSARSSRASSRGSRPSNMESFITSDGGFKRRSRRDVSRLRIRIIFYNGSCLLLGHT